MIGRLKEAAYFRSNPAYPREIGQCGESVPRKEVPEEGGCTRISEEAFTADTRATASTGVLGLMKSVEERAVNQVGRPD